MEPRKICIFRKGGAELGDALAAKVVAWGEKRDVEVIDERARTQLDDADLVVVLGGDGTLLRAVRQLEGRPIPILGVNLGFLGFLTEIQVDELEKVLDEFASGRATIQERTMLRAVCLRDGREIARADVLNDIVISRGAQGRMSELEVSVDGRFLTVYKADGIIVSTPTGSTAYNLSAGGPIICPELNAVLVSPICPHTLAQRPIILPDHAAVVVRLSSQNGDVSATFDGQTGQPLQEGDIVKITRLGRTARLVSSPTLNYFELLRSKLMWGGKVQTGSSR